MYWGGHVRDWPSGLYKLSKTVVWDTFLDSGEDTDARTLASEIPSPSDSN